MDNIILCGFMGAGKTVVGKELKSMIGYKLIDIDEFIEQEQGISIKEIFKIYGEQYFRDLEYEVCKKVATMNNCIISTGGGTITYDRNAKVLKECGKVFFLDASFPIISERIGNSNTRPLFKDREKAKQLYEERKNKYYENSDYIINADSTIEENAQFIINTLYK